MTATASISILSNGQLETSNVNFCGTPAHLGANLHRLKNTAANARRFVRTHTPRVIDGVSFDAWYGTLTCDETLTGEWLYLFNDDTKEWWVSHDDKTAGKYIPLRSFFA